MDAEVWKPAPDWEDRYEVSSHGRVRSLCHRGEPRKRPWMLKLSVSRNGYYRLLFKHQNIGKVKQIHRLVLETFVGPAPSDQHQGAHLDGNPRNNRLDNLMWATRKENMGHRDLHGTTSWGEDRPLSVFTVEEVKELRRLFVNGAKRADLVRETVARKGCDPTVVRDILAHRTWTRA